MSVPFLQYAELEELAVREISVDVAPAQVETFGFLLGVEVSAIGGGHSETVDREKPDDHWLAAEYRDGRVALVVVHDVTPVSRLRRVTLLLLGPAAGRVGDGELDDLAERVRRAEEEAGSSLLRSYTWASVLGPDGEWANINERARHRFGGSYRWPGLSLSPLAVVYEGQARSGALYREHRLRASGSVMAATSEFAQRLADEAAIRAALFLSLMLRTAVAVRQPVASIVEGTREDLDVVPEHVGSSGPPWRLSAVKGSSSFQGGDPDGSAR